MYSFILRIRARLGPQLGNSYPDICISSRVPSHANCFSAAYKTYELEERLETTEEEENNQDTDNNDSDDHWKEFVDAVDAKSIPNLDAYMKAKAIRTETSIRFVNAMDACIQTLRDTTEGILSEVVEPICNRHSEHFNYEEESIVETMVSNHSRRKELLELLHSTDVAWANKYNKLTADIMGDVSNQKKGWLIFNFIGSSKASSNFIFA